MSRDGREGSPAARRPPPFDPVAEAPLLSAYVDGELEAAEVVRIEAHLAGDPDARREIERLRRLKEVTAALRLREAPPEEWERFWLNFYNRAERSVGWFALTLGAVVVGGYGLLQLVQTLWRDQELPWLLRAGIFALGLGVLLLLVSVIRERVYVRKRSRYDDVKR